MKRISEAIIGEKSTKDLAIRQRVIPRSRTRARAETLNRGGGDIRAGRGFSAADPAATTMRVRVGLCMHGVMQNVTNACRYSPVGRPRPGRRSDVG